MAPIERRIRVLLQVIVWVGIGVAPLAAQQAISLVGSGSSVPSPLFNAWAEQYKKLMPGVQVRYLQVGASEGVREIGQGVGDFAAGEIPLTETQMHQGKNPLLQFPTVLVAIVPIYKLPGEPELRFSGELLADIFLGNITNWKDARIAKLNPGVELPDLPIAVIHRSSGKGSNYILTDFMSKVSPQWKSRIGRSASPSWRLGEETNRSEDMVEKVGGTPGAIGYVELNYAQQTNLGTGSVQNSAGLFIRATPASIAAASAATDKAIQSDFGASLTNAPGKDSYPIVSFTNVYLMASGMEPARSQAMKEFLNWALTAGQETASTLGYTVLPPRIAAKAREILNSIR
jgi:phosphate transport system substrate-binding protein